MFLVDVVSDEYSRMAFNGWLPFIALLILLALIFKRRKLALGLLCILPLVYLISLELDRRENIKIQENNRKMREKHFEEEQARQKLQKAKDSLTIIQKDTLQK
jgi:ABC-type multidrug transport system fused ATPase/permease subunit